MKEVMTVGFYLKSNYIMTTYLFKIRYILRIILVFSVDFFFTDKNKGREQEI